jgi:hypothetical protein
MTMRTGDIAVQISTEYDIDRSRLINRFRFDRGGEQLVSTAVHHVYTSAHLGKLLTGAGFTSITRYAGPDGAPFRLGSGRLILAAVRS